MTTIDEVRLLRPREAAALLGYSIRQFDRIVEDGALKPVRVRPGANRRFRLADVARLVAETKED